MIDVKSPIELNSFAVELRDELNMNPYIPIDLFHMVPTCFTDYTIIFHPMSSNTSGMCVKNGTNSIIGINSNSSLGRQRFTLAHELYHLLYDDNFNEDIVVCNYNDKSDSEQEAELFGSYVLIPYEGLKKFIKSRGIKKWTLDDAIVCEQYFQISHQALITRLLQDGFIDEREFDNLSNVKISHEAKLRGFDKLIYQVPEYNSKRVIGNYVRLVEDAYNSNLISEDKRNGMLLDGFQDEIVYKYKR